MLYLANPSTPAVREAMARGELGAILTPKQGNRLPDGVQWCADNGCGPGKDGKPGTGYPGDEAWRAWLTRLSADADRCLFAVAPDVVGDAAATLARSAPHLPAIRALGYPAALAAQDGLETLDVPWDTFDVLFIGGSTAWKEGPHAARLAREALQRGKKVHMGRVNSARRWALAELFGCDTVDGTFLTFGPEKNLPRLAAWSSVPALPFAYGGI